MNLAERVQFAIRNLTYRQLRTWLTVLGIVVGIAAIIVLISLATGLKESVNQQLASFDPRMILILPINIEQAPLGAPSGLMATSGKLFEKDYMKVKAVAGVQNVAKLIGNRASVSYRDKLITATIYAVEPSAIQEISTINVAEGRFLDDGERATAVLGHSIAKDSFDEEVSVGSYIDIAGRRYRVLGILEKTGNSFANLDNVVYINFDEGKDIFRDFLLPNEISGLKVLVSEGYDVEEVGDGIEETLMNLHKVQEDEKDFSVITPKALGQQVNSIIGILTIFLGAVAAIAFAVGAIGISNTMFMAVMERTHEIGVMKAVGAKKSDILIAFLLEAGIIGLVGGIIGVIVGTGIAFAIALFGVTTKVTLELMLGAMIFAFTVGVLAGLIPARNGSEVSAVEALRYE